MGGILFSWPEQETIDGTWVGIFVQHLGGFGWHAGLLIGRENVAVFALHLLGHRHLAYEHATGRLFGVRLPIEPLRAAVLAAELRRLGKKNAPRSVLYGFSSSKGPWFGDDLAFTPRGIGEGLNCISFVIAALAAAGYPIVEEATWPTRPGDAHAKANFFRRVGKWVSEEAAPVREHFLAMKDLPNVPACRFGELFGAALGETLPADFSAATDGAESFRVVASLFLAKPLPD